MQLQEPLEVFLFFNYGTSFSWSGHFGTGGQCGHPEQQAVPKDNHNWIRGLQIQRSPCREWPEMSSPMLPKGGELNAGQHCSI